MSKLYKNQESLDVLEQLADNEYNLVYLDVPYCTTDDAFYLPEGVESIRHLVSLEKGVRIREVTRDDIRERRKSLEREAIKIYSAYISKVIENTHRILKDDGILAFFSPSHERTDINYRLVLDQFFSSFSVVTIDMRKYPYQNRNDNNYNLYFYSKKESYEFPVLKELMPIKKFHERDERDYYYRIPATTFSTNTLFGSEKDYEWNGIIPSGNTRWRYSREKMDEMLAEDRIVVKGEKVWIKQYRNEHPIIVSSVWKYTDSTDSQFIERMFSMFADKGSRVLCPYERDGKFSFIADQRGLDWEAVYLPWSEDKNLIQRIPKEHYEVVDKIEKTIIREYKKDVVANVSDLADLKSKLEALSADVKRIQSTIGLDDDSEFSVEMVVEQIHRSVTQALSSYSIDGCIPEAQAWIAPFWDKLEPESRYFIPTGLLLYNQFNTEPNIDMAPIMIEYCKSLERELFRKMYYGYINDLIERDVSIRDQFPEAFNRRSTAVFAEFLSECTTLKKETPEQWRFEMGKMTYVLQSALARNPREAIFVDFREYLNRIFDERFFREHFNENFHVITKLRNDCAHPSIINSEDVEQGKDLIRRKLLLLLEYYIE